MDCTGERLLHRNEHAASAWNRLDLRVPARERADNETFLFVFESRARASGLMVAVRSISLSYQDCPEISSTGKYSLCHIDEWVRRVHKELYGPETGWSCCGVDV